MQCYSILVRSIFFTWSTSFFLRLRASALCFQVSARAVCQLYFSVCCFLFKLHLFYFAFFFKNMKIDTGLLSWLLQKYIVLYRFEVSRVFRFINLHGILAKRLVFSIGECIPNYDWTDFVEVCKISNFFQNPENTGRKKDNRLSIVKFCI